MTKILLVIIFILQASVPDFRGKVVRVIDGDTIEVLRDEKAIRIRLNGIDCPEKNQAFGSRAKEFTSQLVFGKIVLVNEKDIDRYGRTIADVYLVDGTWLNKELISNGFAWHYKRYSKDKNLSDAENHARRAKVGLWSEARPIEPWNFRKANDTK